MAHTYKHNTRTPQHAHRCVSDGSVYMSLCSRKQRVLWRNLLKRPHQAHHSPYHRSTYSTAQSTPERLHRQSFLIYSISQPWVGLVGLGAMNPARGSCVSKLSDVTAPASQRLRSSYITAPTPCKRRTHCFPDNRGLACGCLCMPMSFTIVNIYVHNSFFIVFSFVLHPNA